jgi:hypothetical protein
MRFAAGVLPRRFGLWVLFFDNCIVWEGIRWWRFCFAGALALVEFWFRKGLGDGLWFWIGLCSIHDC